tara:strand:+ start:599 stop:769 length:171 start_codon:yes stop_codon:yes gene_type:complete
VQGHQVKTTKLETLHTHAGWRNLSFLKVTTDEGIVGYNESFGSKGTTAAIDEKTQL